MSVTETRKLLNRLIEQRTKLWKLLVDVNVSENLAKTITSDLKMLDSRIFSIQYNLLRA